MAKTVVVLGAAGRIGKAAAQAFLDAGYHVRVATRDGRAVLPGTEPAKADAMSVEQLRAAFTGADVIFNGLNPLYPEWKTVAMPMARNIMGAMRGSGALHLFPGNVYVYGTPMPQVLREDTPQNPTTVKGKIRLDMEALFRREAEEHGARTIVLRAGDFFGAGSGSWFDLVLTAKLKDGVFTTPGPMNLPYAWAYLPDLVAAFARLPDVADRLALYETLHFPGYTVTLGQMKAAIEQAAGKPLKVSKLPWWGLRLTTPFNAMNREIYEMRYLWDEAHSLQSGRLEKLIGPLPATPLNAAIAQTLDGLVIKAAA